MPTLLPYLGTVFIVWFLRFSNKEKKKKKMGGVQDSRESIKYKMLSTLSVHSLSLMILLYASFNSKKVWKCEHTCLD